MPQNLRFRRGTTAERGGTLLYGEPYVNIEINQLEVGGLSGSILYFGTGSFIGGGTGSGFPFSGSAVITGSLFVSNSIVSGTTFTASLQEGYVWVGGANNISYLVQSSSLAHLIQSESVSFPHRNKLNFRRFNVTDDSVNDATIIERPATTAVSSTPPSNPIEGDQWTDSDTFKTYIWYDSYWIEISNTPTGSIGTGAGFPFSGSAVITGSLFVSNSLASGTVFTASLQQGYVWVGGANNISYIVPSSSFINVITTPADNRLLTSNGTTTSASAEQNFTFDGARAIISGQLEVTGSVSSSFLLVSGSSTGSRVVIYGSGSVLPLLTVIGSQGELFSVNDILSGSLLSVNDISGLPVFEVFSDSRVLMGSYQSPSLNTTVKTTLNIGGNIVYSSVPTSSYDAVFYDYIIRSGSNSRAGQIMGIWSGSMVNYTEVVTTDFGNTDTVTFSVILFSGSLALSGSATSAPWTMKAIIRSI